MGKLKQGNGSRNGTAASRRELLRSLYTSGLSIAEIARRLKVSRQRVYELIRKCKFLPQSRYIMEGALAREWMLRHQPAVFRRIVGEAAEQSSQTQYE